MATDFTRLFKQLETATKNDVFKKSLASMKEAAEVAKEIRDLQSEASKSNNIAQKKMLKTEADKMEKSLRMQVASLTKFNENYNKQIMAGNESAANLIKAQAQNLQSIVADLSGRAKDSKNEIIEYNKLLAKSNEAYTEGLKDRKEKIEEMGKLGYLFEEKLMGSLTKGMEFLKDGVSDLSDVPKNIGGFFADMARKKAGAIEAKASQESDPNKAKGMMEMAANFAKLGNVLAMVGGGLAAVVALFVMAEGKVKDMNKEILKGTSATDLLTFSNLNLHDSLEQTRKFFSDSSFRNTIGETSDNLLELASNLDGANLGFKAFGKGDAGIKGMQQAMLALKYETLAMGIEMTDAVTRAQEFAYEVGVSVKDGAFLKAMVGDFADIRDMAVQTGYSTANFYQKVKSLTDSLDNMNLRSKEAGALFIRLGKVIGPGGVEGLLSGAASFKTEDYLEQLKRQMLTSSSKLKKVLKAEAQRSAQAFLDNFSQSKAGSAILKEAGLDTSSSKALVQSLQKMDTTKRQELLGRLAENQETAGLGRELSSVINVARGAKDKAGSTDVARAMDSMGAGAGLAAQYARLETHLGGKSISDLSVVQKKAMMAFTDLSKEQIEQFGKMQDVYKGQFKMASDLAGKKDLTKEEKDRLENLGLKAKDGKLYTKDSDVLVDDISTYILSQSEDIKKSEQLQLTQEQLLSQNVEATVSTADKINAFLGDILMDISSGIMSIVNYFFGKSENSETKQRKQQVATELNTRKQDLKDLSMSQMKEISITKQSLAIEKDKDKRGVLEAKLKEQEESYKKTIEASRTISTHLQSLAEGNYSTGMFESNMSVDQIRDLSALEAKTKEKVYSSEKSAEVQELEKALGFNADQILKSGTLKARAEKMGYQVGDGEIRNQDGATIFQTGADDRTNQMINAIGDTKEYLGILSKAAESSQAKKDAVEQERAIAKDGAIKSEREKQAKKDAEIRLEVEKRDKLRTLSDMLGINNYSTEATSTDLAKMINQRNLSRSALTDMGFTEEGLVEMGVKLNDGFYSKGKIYPVNSKDSVVALKDGGLIQKMMGGNTVNASINVNGANDPKMVAQLVAQEVRKLQEMVQGYNK